VAGGACGTCPSGSQIVNGVCQACAAGYYSTSSSTSTGRCQQCSPGKYSSESGSSTCELCEIGKLSAAYGTTQCALCPLLSSNVNAIGATRCSCEVGYFAADLTNTDDNNTISDTNPASSISSPMINFLCRMCPSGALCATNGITQSSLQSASGYWRSSNDSMEFIRCLRPAHCAAGAIECTGQRTGPLCAVCIGGWQAASIDRYIIVHDASLTICVFLLSTVSVLVNVWNVHRPLGQVDWVYCLPS
jgi:hypothetical protein